MAEKLLVTTKAGHFNLDKLCSVIILAKILARHHKTTVDIFADNKYWPLCAQIVAPTGVAFLEKLDADYFTISLKRDNAKVKQVKWEETADKLNLIVYTEKGQITDKEYSMIPGKPHYDLVTAVGINKLDDVKQVLGNFASVWDSSETLNIDIRQDNARYADANFVTPDSKSYAQAILKYCQEKEIDINNEEATELLACIYWRTNSLRNKFTTLETLTTVNDLLNLGANLSKATNSIFSTLSLTELQARTEILQNMKITASKIAISRVNPDTAKQLRSITAINPDKNPLIAFKEAVASFALVPISENETLVLASSKSKSVNLKRIFTRNQYVGDEMQCELTFLSNVNATEQQIIQAIEKELDQVEVQVTPDTKQQQPQPPKQPPVQPSQPQNAARPPMPTTNQSQNRPQQQPSPKQPVPAKPVEPAPARVNADTKVNDEKKNPTPVNTTKAPEPLNTAQQTPPVPQQADPLAPATEQIIPDPAPASEAPRPMFGGGGGGGGNPFGPI